jgi:hypothetical protein
MLITVYLRQTFVRRKDLFLDVFCNLKLKGFGPVANKKDGGFDNG